MIATAFVLILAYFLAAACARDWLDRRATRRAESERYRRAEESEL